VVEPYYPHWDSELQEWVTDCYVWVAYFNWDPCQSQPIESFGCLLDLLATDQPAGSCCQSYGPIYGCDNYYGC
jgi:hypothetical protein